MRGTDGRNVSFWKIRRRLRSRSAPRTAEAAGSTTLLVDLLDSGLEPTEIRGTSERVFIANLLARRLPRGPSAGAAVILIKDDGCSDDGVDNVAATGPNSNGCSRRRTRRPCTITEDLADTRPSTGGHRRRVRCSAGLSLRGVLQALGAQGTGEGQSRTSPTDGGDRRAGVRAGRRDPGRERRGRARPATLSPGCRRGCREWCQAPKPTGTPVVV
jgi:hypothetical protein